jgi:RimJ/RimL family protein N-acetyltransferase
VELVDGDLLLRALTGADAPLVVDATAGETGPAFWGPRPVGPYTVREAAAALARWQGENISYGLLGGDRLLAVVGLMRDGPASAEVAYWVRPGERGRGLATRALRLLTGWAHHSGLARLWLEIDPDNAASLRVAERAGYRFERRLPDHCRSWVHDDPARDQRHDCLIWFHATGGTPR